MHAEWFHFDEDSESTGDYIHEIFVGEFPAIQTSPFYGTGHYDVSDEYSEAM